MILLFRLFSAAKSSIFIFGMPENNSLNTSVLKILENFTPTETKMGQFSGVSFRPITPLSFKMLFSTKPLRENDPILKNLLIDKDDIKRLKTNNFFSVTQTWQAYGLPGHFSLTIS